MENRALENYDSMLDNPAFKDLELERREYFADLLKKMEGKNMVECMGIIISEKNKMPKGKDLSKDEQEQMLEALLNNMNEPERQKYKKIMKILGL